MAESNDSATLPAESATPPAEVTPAPAKMTVDVEAPAYASMTFDERLAGYNADNEITLKKYGIVLGAEAYIENGRIRSRPVAVPIEQSTLKDE